MPRLIWTPQALQDVQGAYRATAGRNPGAAKRAVSVIRQGARLLFRQPGIGRPVDQRDEAYREWLIGFGSSGYVLLYRLEGDLVTVLAVRHQKEAGV
jgi:plasmid stabilization system protein ParE